MTQTTSIKTGAIIFFITVSTLQRYMQTHPQKTSDILYWLYLVTLAIIVTNELISMYIQNVERTDRTVKVVSRNVSLITGISQMYDFVLNIPANGKGLVTVKSGPYEGINVMLQRQPDSDIFNVVPSETSRLYPISGADAAETACFVVNLVQ